MVESSDDDGGTDPVIFGEISLRLMKNGNVIQNWLLFSRSASPGSRVIFPEKQQQPFYINQPAFTIDASEVNLYSLQLIAICRIMMQAVLTTILGKKRCISSGVKW